MLFVLFLAQKLVFMIFMTVLVLMQFVVFVIFMGMGVGVDDVAVAVLMFVNDIVIVIVGHVNTLVRIMDVFPGVLMGMRMDDIPVAV